MKEIIEDTQKHLKNYYFVALLLILGVATFLRFKYAFFDGVWVDEGRYARAAFEIAEHPWNFHTERLGQVVKWPPVYPYLITLSTYIFGKTDFAVRIISPVMGVIGVGITYLLGKEMKNRVIGLLAAAMITFNPIFWFLSERVLMGATLTIFYSATLLALYYGLEDRKYSQYALWTVSPLAAISVITKQPAYTLGLIIPIYFLYIKRNELKELIHEDIAFRKSQFYETLMNRDYHIAVGLGVLTIFPYILRNMAVCSFPLCSFLRAVSFTSSSGGNSAVTSIQGNMYFIQNMPNILTPFIALLLLLKFGSHVLNQLDKNPDTVLRKIIIVILLTGTAYFVKPVLFAMAAITSVALIADTDSEKLLWLWAGIGIGFMSIPNVKVPRYIVFTIPALVVLASISLYQLSSWLSKISDNSNITAPRIAAILILPLLFLSYTAGLANAQMGGFGPAEPAGEWFQQNTPEETQIMASSPAILRYYAYPRDTHKITKNRSKFIQEIRQKNITYLEVDTYERTQARWVQTDIAPYRLPNEVRIQLRQREITAEEARGMFKQTPGYLEPVARMGRTRVPLSQQQAQPAVIIYRVNWTALP